MTKISKGDVVSLRNASLVRMVVLDFMDGDYAWVCPLGRCRDVELVPVECLTYVRSGAAMCKRLNPNAPRENAERQCVLAQHLNGQQRSEPKLIR